MANFRYDVALSFAGEDRVYVDQVARMLRSSGIRVFYDQFEAAALWGAHLPRHLDDVYRKQSRFVVLFVSIHYANKTWTTFELESAQARAVTEKGAYLLPVRFDETEIPGLRPTTAYLDARVLRPADIAQLMLEKIASDAGPRPLSDPDAEQRAARIPLKKEDNQALIIERPSGWEHILLAGAIWQATSRLESLRRDHEIRFASYVQLIPDSIAERRLLDAQAELLEHLRRTEDLLSRQYVEWAVGGNDRPGDPVRITHLAKRFGDKYEDVLKWAADQRKYRYSPRYAKAAQLLSWLADAPITSLSDLANSFAAVIAAHHRHGVPAEEPWPLPTVRLELDQTLNDLFLRSLHDA